MNHLMYSNPFPPKVTALTIPYIKTYPPRRGESNSKTLPAPKKIPDHRDK